MNKWGWTADAVCFRCNTGCLGTKRIGTDETFAHAIAYCPKAQDKAITNYFSWGEISQGPADDQDQPRKIDREEALLMTHSGPCWWPRTKEPAADTALTEEEKGEIRNLRTTATAATLLAVPKFLRSRVRRKYPREASRIIRDMQKVLIEACKDRWLIRQQAYEEYQTQTGRKLAELRRWRVPTRDDPRTKKRHRDNERDDAERPAQRQANLTEMMRLTTVHTSRGSPGSARGRRGTPGTRGINRNRTSARGSRSDLGGRGRASGHHESHTVQRNRGGNTNRQRSNALTRMLSKGSSSGEG